MELGSFLVINTVMLLRDARQSHIWDLPYLGRPCAQKEFGVGFPRGVYGFKAVQRFELFCQLFSLCLSVEPAGSYIGVRSGALFFFLGGAIQR